MKTCFLHRIMHVSFHVPSIFISFAKIGHDALCELLPCTRRSIITRITHYSSVATSLKPTSMFDRERDVIFMETQRLRATCTISTRSLSNGDVVISRCSWFSATIFTRSLHHEIITQRISSTSMFVAKLEIVIGTVFS